MIKVSNILRTVVWGLIWFGLITGLSSFAQQAGAEEQSSDQKVEEVTSVSSGVSFTPVTDSQGRQRDPFKSPFEIEQEEREKRKALNNQDAQDRSDRLPYSISELELRGIYYQAQSGYRAIFLVGNVYKWWPAGTKFQDADLVNITDGAVIFKHYSSDEDIQVREVVKELHRGEE